MAEVYGNLVILVILVMEGVDRAAMCVTALPLDGGSGDQEGSQSLPVAASTITHLLIALSNKCFAKLHLTTRMLAS